MHGCGQKWAWDSNFNEWMNLDEFLHANTYLRKLKVTLIVIGWAWSNMGVSFQVMVLYNLLYLINEWMNWADFFACSYMVPGKLKVTLGMHMVKYGCDLLSSGTQSINPSINHSINQSMRIYSWQEIYIYICIYIYITKSRYKT